MSTLMTVWRRFRRWLAVRRAPNKGPCAYCGRPVRHYYPWFTHNPSMGGMPLHDDCARSFWSTDD